jgi:hypothetical protein
VWGCRLGLREGKDIQVSQARDSASTLSTRHLNNYEWQHEQRCQQLLLANEHQLSTTCSTFRIEPRTRKQGPRWLGWCGWVDSAPSPRQTTTDPQHLHQRRQQLLLPNGRDFSHASAKARQRPRRYECIQSTDRTGCYASECLPAQPFCAEQCAWREGAGRD